MTLLEWDSNIGDWAFDRLLHRTSFPAAQVGKLTEESGEIGSAYREGNEEEAKDAVGDTLVVLKILCMQSGLDFRSAFVNARCLETRGSLIAFGGLIDMLVLNGEFADAAGKKGVYTQDMVSRYISALYTVVMNTPHWNFTMLDAMEFAWNEIKDRKGVMHKGQFVKEKDVMDSSNAVLISQFKEKYDL